MKKFNNIPAIFAFLLGTAAALGSCVEPDPHRRGGESGDDPSRPGGDEAVETVFEGAYADYYGQYYTDKTDNFLLTLFEGKTDSEGYFTSRGTILQLDLILPKTGQLKLATSEYVCSDRGVEYSFVPAYESKDKDGNSVLDGSTLYIQSSKNVYNTYAVTGGKLSITALVTGLYEIEATILANGTEYLFYYKGTIDIQDGTSQDDPDVPTEPAVIDMKNISRVVAEDWGQPWDNVTNKDYRDWILYFYDKNLDSTKEYTCVEVLLDKKFTKSLPEIKLADLVLPGNPDGFVPGVIIGGFEEGENIWGTWYCNGGYGQYAATKGWLDIKPSEKGYKFSFDFDDEEYNATFKGSYEGKVEFVDKTVSSSAKKAARRSESRPKATSSTFRTGRNLVKAK